MPSPTRAHTARWRAAPRPESRRRVAPPRSVSREVVLPALDSETWRAVVSEAVRVFRQRGGRSEAEGRRRWVAMRWGHHATVASEGSADGVRVAVTVARRRARPWLSAIAGLCVPAAGLAALMRLAEVSDEVPWGVVGGLAAIPVLLGGLAWVAGWAWTGLAHWMARRVLAPAVQAEAAWALSSAIAEVEPRDEPVWPDAVGPTEWLTPEEVEDLVGVRFAGDGAPLPTSPPAAAPRRAARLPEGFTEWVPNA